LFIIIDRSNASVSLVQICPVKCSYAISLNVALIAEVVSNPNDGIGTYQGIPSRFCAIEPLNGEKTVSVTERRTKTDWARFMRTLVDERYPDAEKIVLVADNLNTHTPASFYEAFPPEEARRLAEKIEFRPTPKHGRWLNMAETRLSVLSRQCLQRRMPDMKTLQKEISAWAQADRKKPVQIDWRFTTPDARIKLKKLYPSIFSC
jgi:hypothetical protein